MNPLQTAEAVEKMEQLMTLLEPTPAPLLLEGDAE